MPYKIPQSYHPKHKKKISTTFLDIHESQAMAPSANPPSSSGSTVDETPSRILVPEKLSPDGLALLVDAGFTVDNRPGGLTADELLSLIPSYHALIVRSETKVTAQVLSAGSKLRVVARAGV